MTEEEDETMSSGNTPPEKEYPALRNNPLFRDLEEADFRRALEVFRAECVAYARGDMIHRPGTPMDRFGVVLSGMAQVCVDDLEGSRMIMAEVVPGVIFGESLCFLRVQDSPVYAYAAEDSEVLWLSTEELFAEPGDGFRRDLQQRFIAALATKNLSMNNRIQVLSKLSLRGKLNAYFTGLAASQGSDVIRLPMNREDTAAYIGANRSALSRELARMKEEGLIDFYRGTVKIKHNE